MRDYWMPARKWELVAWLSQNFPGKRWNHLSKKQLQAIYHKIRQQIEKKRCAPI